MHKNLKIFTILFTVLYCFFYKVGQTQATMTYTYDQNGNMTSDGTECFEYNEANQLKKVKNCTTNQTIAEYVYDYNGNRIVKKNYTNGTLANTVTSWSDRYETKEIVGGATEQTSYYFVNGEVVAKKNPDGTRHYYHNDHLGSTSVMTNQAGTVVEKTEYDPWGEVKAGGTKSKFQYTGQERDAETNLHYYNARYYDPHIRRFTQPDDIIQNVYNPQDLNRYSYVRNNPLKYTDPTGHFSIKSHLKKIFSNALYSTLGFLAQILAPQQPQAKQNTTTPTTTTRQTTSIPQSTPSNKTAIPGSSGNTTTTKPNTSTLVMGMSSQAPQSQTPFPQGGYIDLGFSSGVIGPFGGGGGLQVNQRGWLPYIAAGVVSTGKGFAITYSQDEPKEDATSVNFNWTTVGSVGVSYPFVHEPVPFSSGEFSYGVGFPAGGSATVNHTFNTHRW